METTDLSSHHIEGYARADGSHFSTPLVTHIIDNLYVGGCRDGVHLPPDFRHVVSLYPWEKYTLPEGCERVEHRLHDAAEIPDEDLDEIASYAVACIADGKTLVHCQAGLNRSNLISGLALIQMGWEPAEAIALLREKRCSSVLCNRTFAEYLLSRA